ncbi:MAG: hypothetical protein ACREJ6_06970 [Candidatus Methylomirabilis sp.]
MRGIWSNVTWALAAASLVIGPLMTPASAEVARCPDSVIREGEVVEIGETSITLHEWAGVYTYRLATTQRWRLEADQVRPGDKVQFLACRAGTTAMNFKKIDTKKPDSLP